MVEVRLEGYVSIIELLSPLIKVTGRSLRKLKRRERSCVCLEEF